MTVTVTGGNGMEMPVPGLGTYKMTDNEAESAVRDALDMGYRHVDTAERYGNQKAVGKGIKQSTVDREDVFLTTKVWYTNLAPGDARRSLETSLEELGVDYVDLLLVHYPNPDIPLKETLHAFQTFREEGKTRFIGVSNFTAPLLERVLDIAPGLATNQVEMHPYFHHGNVLECCQNNSLVLTAYSALGHGTVVNDPILQNIGETHGASAAQAAIAWLLEKQGVAPLVKAVDEEYLQENLAATELTLSAEDIQKINDRPRKEKQVGADKEYAPWNNPVDAYV